MRRCTYYSLHLSALSPFVDLLLDKQDPAGQPGHGGGHPHWLLEREAAPLRPEGAAMIKLCVSADLWREFYNALLTLDVPCLLSCLWITGRTKKQCGSTAGSTPGSGSLLRSAYGLYATWVHLISSKQKCLFFVCVCCQVVSFTVGLHSHQPPSSPQSLSFYRQNQDITHILDNMDVYVLPVMNPDGYYYTWTTVRMHETDPVLRAKGRDFSRTHDPPLLCLFVSEQDVEEEPLRQQERRLHRSRPQQKLWCQLVQ